MIECVRFLSKEEQENYDFVAEFIKRGAMEYCADEQYMRESKLIPQRYDDRMHALE
jgi:hypothetical protein